MSEQSSVTAPAGWYPDGVAGRLRWWDGTAWTDHYSPGPTAYQPEARPQLAEGTRTDTPWIWVLAVLPLLGLISLPLTTYGMSDYVSAVMYGDYRGAFGSLFGPWYLATIALGLVIYGGSVVVAYLDYAALRRIGVVRPFHWAWTFLYALIYQIGRTVILRKVSRTGYPVLWVAIGVFVLTCIISIVWSFWLTFGLMDAMMQNLPYDQFGDLSGY